MGEICERATENKKNRLGGNFKFSGCGVFARVVSLLNFLSEKMRENRTNFFVMRENIFVEIQQWKRIFFARNCSIRALF